METICKSVFKNGASVTSRTQYTKKWIELINLLEKNKSKTINK